MPDACSRRGADYHGPFQPTLKSLTNFNRPEWFRDVRIGIRAHGGAQATSVVKLASDDDHVEYSLG